MSDDTDDAPADTDVDTDADTDTVPLGDTDRPDDTDIVGLPYTPGESLASVIGDLRFVPGGAFTMGSPVDEVGRRDDEPAHRALLTRGFWIQSTEMSQATFLELVGTLPPDNDCPTCPVHGVDWYEALAVANLASGAEGLAPCYTLTGCTGTLGAGMRCDAVTTAAVVPMACEGYRLPTEAEWEYAARSAGVVVDAFPSGGSLQPGDGTHCDTEVTLTNGTLLTEQAWYCRNLSHLSTSVGLLAPNQLGLRDMAGNVWELVWDGYDEYPSGFVVDPVAPPAHETSIMRGGGNEVPEAVRMAVRIRVPSWDPFWQAGLRLVQTAR